MNIEQSLLTLNEYSRPGKKLAKVKGIVIHWIAKAFQPPEGVIKFWEDRKDQISAIGYGSAHYVIGLDGRVFLSVPEDEVAYHVGANSYEEGIKDKLSTYPNNCTIGIEMCHTDTGFEAATEEAAIELAANLCKKNNLTAERLFRHYDVTGKDCPKFYIDDETKWENFKAKVAALLA